MATKSNPFSYSPNQNGGLNYFNGVVPITNEQYRQATGMDTNYLEQQAQQQRDSITGPLPTYNPFSSNTFGNAVAASQPTGGSSSTGTYTPPVTYLGKQYDLSNPDQAMAYREAQIANLGAQRDQNLGQIDQQLTQGLGDAATQNANALGTYNQGAEDYARQFAGNVQNLGEGYSLGQVNSRQAFAGLGANAYQSGQGSSAQYAQDKYNQGLDELGRQADETVGRSYLQGNGLDSNSQIGRQVGSLNQGYDAYVRNAQQQAQQARQQANASYGSGVDSASSGLQAAYAAAGLQLPSFQSQQYNPFSSPTLDISKYTPYTSAAQLQGLPGAQGVGTSGNPFQPGNNQYVNQFLNRTPQSAA